MNFSNLRSGAILGWRSVSARLHLPRNEAEELGRSSENVDVASCPRRCGAACVVATEWSVGILDQHSAVAVVAPGYNPWTSFDSLPLGLAVVGGAEDYMKEQRWKHRQCPSLDSP